MRNRLFSFIIMVCTGIIIFSGCSTAGYSIGSDPPEIIYSIKNADSPEKYYGRMVVIVDTNRARHEAKLDSITLKKDGVTRYFHLTERFSDNDNGRKLRYSEAEIKDITITEPDTSTTTVVAVALIVGLALILSVGLLPR